MKDGTTLKGRVQQAEGTRIALTDARGHTKSVERRDVAAVRHAGETESVIGGIAAVFGGGTFLVGALIYDNVKSDPDAGYDGHRVGEIVGGAGAMLAGSIIAVTGGGVFLGGCILESNSRDAFDKARSVSLLPMVDPSGERHGVMVRWRW